MRWRLNSSIDNGNATISANSADIITGTGAPMSTAASWITTVSAMNKSRRSRP